ncbi:hypothetical protein ES703_87524 [subsurface metagenome]
MTVNCYGTAHPSLSSKLGSNPAYRLHRYGARLGGHLRCVLLEMFLEQLKRWLAFNTPELIFAFKGIIFNRGVIIDLRLPFTGIPDQRLVGLIIANVGYFLRFSSNNSPVSFNSPCWSLLPDIFHIRANKVRGIGL